MKNFIILATCIVFSFSSFTMSHDKLASNEKQLLKSPLGNSFSAKDSYTWYNLYGLVCNGDIIYFPYVTVSYSYHGVLNKNMYMVHGVSGFEGVGRSIYTGEFFVADFETKYRDKIPFVNGALVIKSKTDNSFISEGGTVDRFQFSYHLTFNANGELAAEKSKLEITCE